VGGGWGRIISQIWRSTSRKTSRRNQIPRKVRKALALVKPPSRPQWEAERGQEDTDPDGRPNQSVGNAEDSSITLLAIRADLRDPSSEEKYLQPKRKKIALHAGALLAREEEEGIEARCRCRLHVPRLPEGRARGMKACMLDKAQTPVPENTQRRERLKDLHQKTLGRQGEYGTV